MKMKLRGFSPTSTGGSGSGAVWGVNITGNINSQTDLQNQFATKEDISNKVTSFSSPNDTSYPTTLATSTLVSASVVNLLNKTGDTITGEISNTATTSFQVPQGTTAERPTGANGKVRYNTTTSRHEFFAQSAWNNHVRLNGDTMTGGLTIQTGGVTRAIIGDTNGEIVIGNAGVSGSATPSMTGLYSTPASGTNITGSRFRQFAGASTGNATGTATTGGFAWATSVVGASGATQQSYIDRMVLRQDGSIQIGSQMITSNIAPRFQVQIDGTSSSGGTFNNNTLGLSSGSDGNSVTLGMRGGPMTTSILPSFTITHTTGGGTTPNTLFQVGTSTQTGGFMEWRVGNGVQGGTTSMSMGGTGSTQGYLSIGNGSWSSVQGTALLDLGANTTAYAQLRLRKSAVGTDVAAINEGEIYNSGSVNGLIFSSSGLKGVSLSQFRQSNTATVGNTIADTSILGASNIVASKAISANELVVGRTYSLDVIGFISVAAGSQNATFNFKIGGVTVATTGLTAMNAVTNALFVGKMVFTCRSVSLTVSPFTDGTIIGQGYIEYSHPTNGVTRLPMVMTATATVDTKIPRTIDLSAQWQTQSAGNTLSITNATISII